MMFMPSVDGFLTMLQESGRASFTTTHSDDLAFVIPFVVHQASTIGVDIEIHAIGATMFMATVKKDSYV